MSEFEPRLRLAKDLSPANWLRERVVGFGVAASLVPAGFDAYAQVLHPAIGPEETQIRWREAAQAVAQPLLPGVWFQDLEEFAVADDLRPPIWEQAPQHGEIPDDIVDALRPILSRYTASEHGWFCLWDGWGEFTGSTTSMIAWPADNPPPPSTPHHYRARPAFPPEILNGPKVTLPSREYLLFEGPLDAVGELGAWVSWIPNREPTFQCHTPSLWWPDDRCWCAGNEIDAGFTCIAGTRPLIDELLRHPDLEVLELDPDDTSTPTGDPDDHRHDH